MTVHVQRLMVQNSPYSMSPFPTRYNSVPVATVDRTQYLIAVRDTSAEYDQDGEPVRNTERYSVRYDLVTSHDMLALQLRMADLETDIDDIREQLTGKMSNFDRKELRGDLLTAEADLVNFREETAIVGLVRGDQPLTVYHCDRVQSDSDLIVDWFTVTARTSNLREWVNPSM